MKVKALKKGMKIKLYFHCAGVVSKEDRIIVDFDDTTITTDETIRPDTGGEEYERFDRKTGKCLNDNNYFNSRRTIDPI
jgi:hypothetical protein